MADYVESRAMTKEEFLRNISRRMKSRMLDMDMTIGKLGDKSGVPERNISNYVAMRHMIPADALAKIAEALGVSADWLLGMGEYAP